MAAGKYSLHDALHGAFGCTLTHQVHSLKLTANAPENRSKPKRKGLFSNHPFSGAYVSFREGTWEKNC